jgi:hypothetical protein
MKRIFIGALFALALVGCGQSAKSTGEGRENAGDAVAAMAAQDEYKYECRATVLNGYQWVYVGKASRAEAEKGRLFCYGYDAISPYCTLVRLGGALGAIIPCRLATLTQKAYTWNRIF